MVFTAHLRSFSFLARCDQCPTCVSWLCRSVSLQRLCLKDNSLTFVTRAHVVQTSGSVILLEDGALYGWLRLVITRYRAQAWPPSPLIFPSYLSIFTPSCWHNVAAYLCIVIPLRWQTVALLYLCIVIPFRLHNVALLYLCIFTPLHWHNVAATSGVRLLLEEQTKGRSHVWRVSGCARPFLSCVWHIKDQTKGRFHVWRVSGCARPFPACATLQSAACMKRQKRKAVQAGRQAGGSSPYSYIKI